MPNPQSISPLRTLLAQRGVCRCSSVQQRLLSSTRRNASPTQAPPISGYGSAELLRRHHKQELLTPSQVAKAERARSVKRMRWSAYGIVACAAAIFGTIVLYPDPRKAERRRLLDLQEEEKTDVVKLDAPPSIGGGLVDPLAKPDDVEQVPTGTSTIPTFPKTIHLPSTAPASSPAAANEPNNGQQSSVEYQLVGLGVRTVSILSIQVYVVGLYIAVSDIAALQERLVHSVAAADVATTLVPGEKKTLREKLLDKDEGEDLWNAIIRDGNLRTAFRIVPTRATDFMHLRDGFVRGVTARSAHFASDRQDLSFQDESFGQALNEFKSVFGGTARRKLPKGEVLLLSRDARGTMGVYSEDNTGTRVHMGEVADERVGRLLALNYLAGAQVSSEPLRKSVIDGVLEFVERPVGTVATQVV
ncbi:hypothetical protein LTR84_007273 [Exophiala bonariae]|uniref:Chalcone isomerase domain-containing protein n=1 Tax=Exophiala bonariae TaxID=1690606 RepID=A0AAV9MYX5_9EURO|nr:hypothetical protein LTR84_007273 [Exophiala bonariae]